MHSSLLVDLEKIAELTHGVWENLDKNIHIKEFHHTYHYLQKDDAFVVISDNWPNQTAYKSNEHKIQRAINRGVSAIIVKEDLEIDATIPILRVENTYFAMESLAKYVSKSTKAKKVLISGSYGKTGFKTHLKHIVKNQRSTYARINSANFAASSYCNLASIKKENELFFMEIPIANREKMTRRSKLVSPNIGVITSIGHEGIERWKSINRIIRYKLLIAKGIPSGGKLLLPYDDRYYVKILKEAQKYEDINILTYGSSSSCNAHILYKHFSDFGWDVVAKIEDKIVSYRVPFFEEYAVASSLGELLCAYYFGIDVHDAANEYYGCTNFKSSGNLYSVDDKGKSFYLYDQTDRGGIEGYESFFKTLSYIKPKRNGKKILVTSEFVDYIDGEMENIDIPYFQKLIDKSGIKLLFSVEKFSEHINVLKDKSIWINHSIDFNNIKDEIMNSIEDDDILCVKSIFDSSLTKFIKYIKNISGIKVYDVVSPNSMKNQNEALKNLRCLDISDLENFKQHIGIERKKLWIYYFPFLYFFSLSSSRELLMGEEEGSLKLFLFDKFHRTTLPNLELFIPPAPFNASVLANCFENVRTYKNKKNEKIIWVDTDDLVKIKKDKQFEHMKFKFKEAEFVFDPKLYTNLAGKKFRNIRQQLSNVNKLNNVEVFPYESKYQKKCLALLKKWENTKGDKNTFFEDSTYTRNTLKYAHLFDDKDLFGLVVFVNGEVKAFSFAGEIIDGYGNLFIGKSDFEVRGLQSFIKYHTILKSQYCEFVNDSSGLGDKGMTNSKRMFRPVKMEKVYKAETRSIKRKILLTKENLLLYAFDEEKFEIKLLDESYLSQLKIVQEHAEVTDNEYFSDKYFLKYLNNKNIYGFIAKDSGELYGYCVLKERGKWIEIFELAVSKEHQKHGYATALIVYVINNLLMQGKEFIYLVVDTKKTDAKRLYEKIGFKTNKLIRDYVKDVDVLEMDYGE